VSIERLETKMSFVPRYSNRDALLRNYDWYVAHRDEYRGKIGISHRVPWKKGALQLAKYFFLSSVESKAPDHLASPLLRPAGFPQPTMLHPYPNLRFDAKHPR